MKIRVREEDQTGIDHNIDLEVISTRLAYVVNYDPVGEVHIWADHCYQVDGSGDTNQEVTQ